MWNWTFVTLPCCDCAMTPGDFFAAHPLGLAVFDRVSTILGEVGDFEVRVTKSQVSFQRRRGFAYLWLPGQYLDNPQAQLVLSIALGRQDDSARWKEVAHPTAQHWIHHLEVGVVDEIDAEVAGWLREAAGRA